MNNSVLLLLIFIAILASYLIFINYRKKKKQENKKATEIIEERKKDNSTEIKQEKSADEECCGQHEVCERDSLINTKIIADYYDDEELDVFIGKKQENYTDEEIRVFENIFYTLKEFDVAGWLKSLQIRGIELPDKIKEEALLIMKERRFKV